MRYDAIIFDMDGTIIDTDFLWRTASKKLIEHLNIFLSEEEINAYEEDIAGLDTYKDCEIFKQITGVSSSIEELFTLKTGYVAQLLEKDIPFVRGFEAFYRKNIPSHMLSALATNTDEFLLQRIDQLLNLTSFFGEHVYSGSQINRYKPHPDIYLYVASKLKVKAERCIVIEDSAIGIQAAHKAGMLCIGINTSNNRDALQEADIIIDSYDELRKEDLLYGEKIGNV